MSEPKSRLAALAGLAYQAGTQQAETERVAARQETDAEYEARMKKRAQRVTHKTEAWDRDELANRYAWMLLLACEFRRTERVLKSLASVHERKGDEWRGRADALERIARDAMRVQLKQSHNQSERAHKPRRDAELVRIVKALAKRDANAKALWPALRDKLDANGCPTEVHEGSEPRQWRIKYIDADGNTRHVTMDNFGRMLKEYRNTQ